MITAGGTGGFIIPAIDIIDGKCVRLSQGDYNKKEIYNDSPVEVAKQFEDAGLSRLHLVDLDGAKSGKIKNIKVLEQIASATGLVIDFGGGVTDLQDVANIISAGAEMVTIGSLAVRSPGILEEWVMEIGSHRFFIGADVLDEKIKIHGWMEETGITVFDFIEKMMALDVHNIFCTDISRDGMLQGSSVELYRKIIEKFPERLKLFASGGVSNIDDVTGLKEAGCSGVIIGKAIYEGKISLNDLAKFNL